MDREEVFPIGEPKNRAEVRGIWDALRKAKRPAAYTPRNAIAHTGDDPNPPLMRDRVLNIVKGVGLVRPLGPAPGQPWDARAHPLIRLLQHDLVLHL